MQEGDLSSLLGTNCISVVSTAAVSSGEGIFQLFLSLETVWLAAPSCQGIPASSQTSKTLCWAESSGCPVFNVCSFFFGCHQWAWILHLWFWYVLVFGAYSLSYSGWRHPLLGSVETVWSCFHLSWQLSVSIVVSFGGSSAAKGSFVVSIPVGTSTMPWSYLPSFFFCSQQLMCVFRFCLPASVFLSAELLFLFSSCCL